MSPPDRPVLVYDGACAFCRRWVSRLARVTGERLETIAYQDAGARFPEIAPGRFAEAVHLREPGGRWSRGAEAALLALAAAPGWSGPARAYSRWRWFAVAAEAIYRWVARHRSGLSRLP